MPGGGGGGSKAPRESWASRKAALASARHYETLSKISREQWDTWKGTSLPVLRQVTGEAAEAGSPGAISTAVGAAGADVDQSFDQAGGTLRRSLGRYGLNPASGRFSGALTKLGLGRAAAKAGAMTTAGRTARDDGFRKRLAVVGLGGGLPGQAMSGLASAGAGAGAMHGRYMASADAAANRASQESSSLWGGIGQLAGTAIMASALSDKRVKTDVEEVGELYNGLKVYKYRYLGDPKTTIGVMADQVEAEIPGAVIMAGGLRRVDYARAAV